MLKQFRRLGGSLHDPKPGNRFASLARTHARSFVTGVVLELKSLRVSVARWWPDTFCSLYDVLPPCWPRLGRARSLHVVLPARFPRVLSTKRCHGDRFARVLSSNLWPGGPFARFARLVIAIFVRFYRTIYAMVLVLLETARHFARYLTYSRPVDLDWCGL